AIVSNTVTVSANASDNVGVAGVQFKLDGTNLGAEDAAAPYSIFWNTVSATNGSHILTAVARDAAGNQATAAGVTVTVNNPVSDTQAPTVPTNLTATAVSSSQINLSWSASTDNVGVTGYRIFRCSGAACAPSSQISTSTNPAYSDTALSPSTTYAYAVSAYDAAGNNSNQTSPVSATTSTPLDTTPPTVSITSPTSGSTVSGIITVSATATDSSTDSGQASGVAGVQFKLDGTNLGAEDAAAPYGLSWNTAGVANGSRILTATARDAAGNISISPAITIIVNNIVSPPPVQTLSVSLSANPSAGNAPLTTILTATISGTAAGSVNYTFYCNRPDSAINLTSPYSAKYNNESQTTKTHSCVYNVAGTYTAKVIVEQGSASPVESRAAITVSPPPDGTYISSPEPFTQTLSLDSTGEEVKKLQEFLGVTPQTGYFGPITQIAVQKFQLQYNLRATTIIDEPTRAKLNELYGQKKTITMTMTMTLKYGMMHDQIKTLQQFLAKDKTIYPEGLITGYFGFLTQKAVQRFQCKYNIVCWGTPPTTGYGQVGPKTREKLNSNF
ncbi:MAG: Ig-like domain-containing protein, partial [Patescibacteria group bacterium]